MGVGVATKEFYEIRIHGRAGQGAKTASQLLAEAAIEMGMYAQSFPEFGAERTGAPMKAYCRLSRDNIEIHYQVTEPDIVIVMDEGLFDAENVLEGIKSDSILVVNTTKSIEELRKRRNIPGNVKVYTINATGIALELFGKNFANIPLVGSIVKLLGIFDAEDFYEIIKKKFIKKLGEEGVRKNIEAFERGMKELSS